MPFSFNKKRFQNRHRQAAEKQNNYSHGITLRKCLAPAVAQIETSSLMRRMTIATGAALLLKTRAFLSFHISHPTRNNREDRAFVGSVLSERTASHQDFTESNRSHGAVWIASPSHEKTAFQIRTEKRHLKIRCAADSCT